VSFNQWDDANIGKYSIALGRNTTAKGESSIALGQQSGAFGVQSTAIGHTSVAHGVKSTALGSGNAAGERFRCFRVCCFRQWVFDDGGERMLYFNGILDDGVWGHIDRVRRSISCLW
jgi:hypothetical protein